MELKTDRNCHAKYNLEYHLILVTKYRKKCIDDKIFDTIKAQAIKILSMNGGVVEEINHDGDHVHMLISVPPQTCLSSMINSLKSTTARLVRRDHKERIEKIYWKPYFWSRSYLILSTGGAPIEVIRKYIQEQGAEK